ncbi:MAG TPA: tRNA pseudouridine(13) synthase TruD [Candidatus Nanoarchaeia archaeon]|nr:tRNA pseudouridine(13) synthase TruD [Candidatus Nanoarchaeia archaeon]
MYLIKETPEDFIVEEIPKLEFNEKGEYCYFLLEKKNRNTADVIREIAGKLKFRERNFNAAGNKDKLAITKQYVSGFRVKRQRLESLKIANVKLTFVGYGDSRLRLGQLIGNKFIVTVRGLEKEGKRVKFTENYFDEQRFSGRNALLGKALVKKEFRKFCFMLRLKWKEGDYVNAIRTISKKRLIFYVNAYQSWLWNRAIAEYLTGKLKHSWRVDYSMGEFVFSAEKLDNKDVPIIGYKEIEGEFKEIYDRLLEEEKLKQSDFLIKELPELISEGTTRKLYADVKELNVSYKDDERHRGKRKATASFILGSGSYATIVVKKMFGNK